MPNSENIIFYFKIVLLAIFTAVVLFFINRLLIYIEKKWSKLNWSFYLNTIEYKENFTLFERALFWFLNFFFTVPLVIGVIFFVAGFCSLFIDFEMIFLSDRIDQLYKKVIVISLSLFLMIIGILGVRFVSNEKRKRIEQGSSNQIHT